MTEQEFRKAWGLDLPAPGSQLMVDVRHITPLTSTEELFDIARTTRCILGVDPCRKDDEGTLPVVVGSVYHKLMEGEFLSWGHMPRLRGKYMRGEPMTPAELQFLEDND